MDKLLKLELLTIRYLGWIGEKLAIDSTHRGFNVHEARTTAQCCDRIEHIVQSVLDEVDSDGLRLHKLIGDVEFMQHTLSQHATALATGLRTTLPTTVELDELLAECRSMKATKQETT